MNEALQLAPSLLASTKEGGGHGGGILAFGFFSFLILAVLFAVLSKARSGFNGRVFTNKLAGAAEQLYLFLENFALGIIGPHGKRYLPMLTTFWLWIFASNMFGLFFNYTPTADLSSNLGLAIVAVIYVQYEGIKVHGVGGYLRHFAGPKLGGPLVLVSGMIFLIEIVSEFMKMVSLPLRLYGNINGGHEVVMNLNNLGVFNLFGLDFAVPVGALLIPIKLLTVIVQALVFTLLFCVYLGLATHHEEDHNAPSTGDLQAGHA